MFNHSYIIASGLQMFGIFKRGPVETLLLISTDCPTSANCTASSAIQELKNTVRQATHFLYNMNSKEID